jgi:hypothetical protein
VAALVTPPSSQSSSRALLRIAANAVALVVAAAWVVHAFLVSALSAIFEGPNHPAALWIALIGAGAIVGALVAARRGHRQISIGSWLAGLCAGITYLVYAFY